MKKIIILYFGLMCLFSSLLAQHSIKGILKDENNQPLVGVVVYVPSINKSNISDAKGYYEIKNLHEGVYVVEFKLLGYKTISKKIQIEASDVEMNIQMQPSAREIDEVIVTTAADVVQQKENPLPVKSINFDNLNENANNNIIEAIGKKDNIWALNTGPGIAKPIIRGLGYNRTVVLVNGLKQEGQQWGDEHGIEIDQYSIQKAEIIKGPGSIMFGSDALAGVINFIPYRIYQEGWKGKYMGLYQSNNQMFSNTAMVQLKKNDYAIYLQATQKDASNYQNRMDGKVFGTGFNERNVSADFQLNKQWGFTNFFASVFTQQLNMPEGDRDSSGRFLMFVKVNDSLIGQMPVSDKDLKGYNFFVPYQYIQHYRFQNYSVFNLKNNSKIISNIGYQYNIRDEYGPDKLVEKKKEEDGEEEERGDLSMHLHTIPYQIKFLKNIDSTQLISIGTTGMYQMNFNKGEELLIPDYSLLDNGWYVYYQKDFGKWNMAGGVRWDLRSIHSETMFVDSLGKRIEEEKGPQIGQKIKFTEFDKQYNNFSGTLGTTYNGWKDVSLKFNVARGFRTPNISELASNGAHEGTVRYEYGNLQLKPEFSYQADMGILINKEHLLFEITPFVNYIENYIYIRRLSSLLGGDSIINQDGENLWAFTYNQSKALIYGGEINLDIHPHPLDWLHFESNFSYLQGQILNQPDSTRYLPFFPPSRWTNEIRLEWNNVSSYVKRFFAKLEAMYVFPTIPLFQSIQYRNGYTRLYINQCCYWYLFKVLERTASAIYCWSK
ncbi:MAG: TonB-dependent receptor [Bacteroidia bacterium]|nr:MAG: TonB-dependent receptor [Bacteroidia bacterium]